MTTFLMLALSMALSILILVPWLVILMAPLLVGAAPLLSGLTMWIARSKRAFVVLVADDDEISLAPLLLALQKTEVPVQIHLASSGWEALASLKKLRFDLLILDYMMPDLSGEELLQNAELLAPTAAVTPVVFYTGERSSMIQPSHRNYQSYHVEDIWEKSLGQRDLGIRLKNEFSKLVQPVMYPSLS